MDNRTFCKATESVVKRRPWNIVSAARYPRSRAVSLSESVHGENDIIPTIITYTFVDFRHSIPTVGCGQLLKPGPDREQTTFVVEKFNQNMALIFSYSYFEMAFERYDEATEVVAGGSTKVTTCERSNPVNGENAKALGMNEAYL